MVKRNALLVLFVLLKLTILGQNPVCPSPIIYLLSGTTIMGFNTSLPISATNPFSTGIPSPPGNGLTVMPNIHGGPLSPTFYATNGSGYIYWTGSAWVSAGVTTNGGGTNIGGCNSAIFSLLGSSVYCHTVGTTSSTFVTNVTTAVADLVPDCDCNFYIFSSISLLKKYSPTGALITTYTMVGIPGPVGGGGYAIVGSNVFCTVGNVMYMGTIGTGSIVTFNPLPGTILGGSDWGSCAVDLNSVPVVSTISVNASSCQTATVMATSNSPVTYSWSGPGITGPVTTSAVVTNSTGVYSCTIFSSGCGPPPTLTLTTAMGTNTCISVTSNSITCASLGSATVTSPGIGPFSFTWNPGGQVGPVATNLAPGTYTISVYDAFFNLTYTTTTTLNALVPMTATLSATGTLSCNGVSTGTAAFTNISGGSSTQNYSWTNGINTYTVAQPSNLSAGVWSATVTDALTGCTISNLFQINQPPPLTLTLSASNTSACVGSSVVLTGTAGGGTPAYTYTWVGGPTADTYSASNTAGLHVYTLNASDANNCQINNTLSVTFVAKPVLSLANVSICPQQTGTLTASGATSYTWNTSATGNSLSDNPTSTTTYTVTGEALGCASTATASLILKTSPTVSFASNSPVCAGQNLSFTCSAASSYVWTGVNTFSSFTQTNTITNANTTHSGAYQVTITAANGCTAGTSGTVTVKPSPTLTLSPGNTSICINSPGITLSANGTATLYNWSPTTGLSANNTSTVFSNPGSSVIYTVSATLNGCVTQNTVSVTVVSLPTLNISLSNFSACAQAINGSPNTINLTAGGAGTYTILTAPDFNNSNPIGPTSAISLQAPYASTGISTATVFGTNGVCTVSTTSTFVIVPNPTISLNQINPAICEGNSYTYTAGGANSYAWSSVTPGNTLNAFGPMAIVNPTVTSIFEVSGFSQGCSSSVLSTTLTVNPLPRFAITPNPTFICVGVPTKLTVSGSGNTYEWRPSNWLSSGNQATVMANPPSLQTYTVIGALNNCTNSAMVTLSVMPLPVPAITNKKPVLCMNESLQLEGSGGLTYRWDAPNGLFFTGKNLKEPAIDLGYSGNYTLTAVDENTCQARTSSQVTVNKLPGGYLNPSKESGCVPFESDFEFKEHALNVSPIKSTNWNLSGPLSLGAKTFTSGTFSYSFVLPGIYEILGSMRDSNDCANTTTTTVMAFGRPTADFDYEPKNPIENFDEVKFINTSKTFNASVRMKNYNWFFVENENSSRQENPSVLFEAEGFYPVALVISDENGCLDSVVKVVKVEPDLAVFVPNIFTPNGDNCNEVFKPVMRGVYNFRFSIYDRWGEKLFDTNDPSAGWDGSYKGKACQQDDYTWRLVLTSVGPFSEQGKTHEKETRSLTGHVLLHR